MQARTLPASPAAHGVEEHGVLGHRVAQRVKPADLPHGLCPDGHVVSEAARRHTDSDRAEIVLVEKRLLEGLEPLEKCAAFRQLDAAQDHTDPWVAEVREHFLGPGGRYDAVPVREQEHVPRGAGERHVQGGLLAGEALGLVFDVDHARPVPDLPRRTRPAWLPFRRANGHRRREKGHPRGSARAASRGAAEVSPIRRGRRRPPPGGPAARPLAARRFRAGRRHASRPPCWRRVPPTGRREARG